MDAPSRCRDCEEVGSDAEGSRIGPIIKRGSWNLDNGETEVKSGFDAKLDSSESLLKELGWDFWVVRAAVESVWDGRFNGKGVRSRGVGPK